jgi:hypothetical protein
MFCGSCGTEIKEGAKFCAGYGSAVESDIQKQDPESEPKTELGQDAGLPEPKIDKAVFYHAGKQIYACYLYKSGITVGNMTDTMGVFIPDVKECLQSKYSGIAVELKEF